MLINSSHLIPYNFFRVFMMGDVNATGLQSLSSLDLVALGAGTMGESFQIAGMRSESIDSWNISFKTRGR